jgi:putative ABC transport system substrate-binding protein
MRRRQFLLLLGGVAGAWPSQACAQHGGRQRLIGVLNGFSQDTIGQLFYKSFKQELEALGWVEDQNLRVAYRSLRGNREQFRVFAAELVATGPDLILAMTTPALVALQQQTRDIPLIFCNVSDPVDGGFVKSMARPGGNITGFTSFEYSIGGKWLQLLKDVKPTLTRVLVLNNSQNYTSQALLRTIQSVAPTFGVQTISAPVRNVADVKSAINAFALAPNGGIIILPDPVTTNAEDDIIQLATTYRLPALHQRASFVTRGGLLSYGTDFLDVYRRAAMYANRVFRGEKIGELPVQNPVRYELSINRRTAITLGLKIPPKLLFTADKVIE